MLVGARIIKTGIAVMFVIYISQWSHLESGIGYIVASSVLAIQPSVYRSWRQLRENIEANLIGAVFAIGGISLFGTRPAVIGLIIILVIAINLRLRLERSLDLAVFVVIALAYSSQDHYLTYALHRFLFIMVGISFATLINMFVLPPNHHSRVFESIKAIWDRLSLLLRLGVTQEVTEFRTRRVELNRDLERLNGLYRLYREERPVLQFRLPLSKYRTKVVAREMVQTLYAEMRLLEAIESLPEPDSDFALHVSHVTAYHERLLKMFEGLIGSVSSVQLQALYDENSQWIHSDNCDDLLFAAWLTRDIIQHLEHLGKLVRKSHSRG
jgi:uncharacterized membrane protein YgaE (UPF0421/DUF939 family)